jgi:hypothetical protein
VLDRQSRLSRNFTKTGCFWSNFLKKQLVAIMASFLLCGVKTIQSKGSQDVEEYIWDYFRHIACSLIGFGKRHSHFRERIGPCFTRRYAQI